MNVFRIRTYAEYINHVERNRLNYSHMQQVEAEAGSNPEREFTIKGISHPAGQLVDFKVDYLSSDGKNINWRERIECPVTGLNNRLRSCLHILDFELSPYPDSIIYITEQVTPLFNHLNVRFSNLIGSEYLGNDLESGIVQNNIRHEDMTKLSLADESVEYYLSFECFEHIPNYTQAISEAFRVLKPGGVFLGSFPFDRNNKKNLIKAKLDKDGSIIFLMEPEYHGDPVAEKGILCFTIFGWEIIEEFHREGFEDAYAMFIWSDVYGYLGGEQIFFIAKKGISKRKRNWLSLFNRKKSK
jgi:SAM-dependent methyltransferase